MTGLLTLNKSSFTAGELDLSLMGRGDLAAFANGAKRLRNVVIAPTGGVSRRPGLRHIDTARGPGRLIAFEFNTQQTYLMVVTHLHLDIYADDVHMAGLDTPWTSDQIPQIAWTQSADTLLVTHPDVPPRKITRTGANSWSMAEWAFYEENDVLYRPDHLRIQAAVVGDGCVGPAQRHHGQIPPQDPQRQKPAGQGRGLDDQVGERNMDNLLANQLGPKGAILAELAILDIRSARPLRAVLAAQAAGQPANAADLQSLASLEAEATALRSRLSA